MNPIDIIFIILIAALVALAVRGVYNRRKKGKASCGCENCDCGHDHYRHDAVPCKHEGH